MPVVEIKARTTQKIFSLRRLNTFLFFNFLLDAIVGRLNCSCVSARDPIYKSVFMTHGVMLEVLWQSGILTAIVSPYNWPERNIS